MINIRELVNLVETYEEGAVSASVQLINRAANKFGRYNLAAGNCGTFAFALAICLRQKGFTPSFALIHKYQEENDYSLGVDALLNTDPDIYHIVTLVDGHMFDASGEISTNDLLKLSIREYSDTHPGFIQNIGMDEIAIRDIIENDTNWSISTASFLQAMGMR